MTDSTMQKIWRKYKYIIIIPIAAIAPLLIADWLKLILNDFLNIPKKNHLTHRDILIFLYSAILGGFSIWGIFLRNKQVEKITEQIEQQKQDSKDQEDRFDKQIDQQKPRF